MHEAARTIVLQTQAAAPAVAGTKAVSYPAWLFTMLLPMWVGVRVMSRSWATAIALGGKHRRSGQSGHDVVEERAGVAG
jgi:hypothetical protein